MKKEVRAKIEEQLNNVPGYQTILEEATGVSYEQQKKNEDAENTLLGSRKLKICHISINNLIPRVSWKHTFFI